MSGALLRDIRNMKRNQTMTQKEMILSAKELKKARSSQQIHLNQFLQTKNEKIKNIDERLQLHQNEIEKNNAVISELTSNFMALREQMNKEREKSQNEERKNKLLRQQIERTNKMLRVKNLKIDEFTKKIEHLDKEIEIHKGISTKLQESHKQLASLRKQITHLQESLTERKTQITQKEKEIQRLKQRSSNLNALKCVEEELKKELANKQITVISLTADLHRLQQDKASEMAKNSTFQEKIKDFEKKLSNQKSKTKQFEGLSNQYKKNYEESQKKVHSLQNQQNSINSKLKSQQGFEAGLRTQIEQFRNKCEQIDRSLSSKMQEGSKKDQTIEKLTKKINEMASSQVTSSKEIDDLKISSSKMEILRKKSRNLQDLYKSMVPQIQCPYGHELNNPVTIIPCGHNYCLGCKKGYAKECMECHGKLKIEAVYRNQLMDDIIGIVNGIKQVIEIIK